MPLTVSDEDLANILADVEKELGLAFKSETAAAGKPLSKADEDKPGDEAPPSDSASPDASASPDSAPPDASPPPAAPPGPDASAAPPPDASAPPPGPDADASAGPDASFQALVAEYAKLPPDQQKMQYMAAKTALFQTMGAQGGGAPPDTSAPPSPAASAPPAGPAASAPPPGPPPAMKAEIAPNPANGGKMAKSEAEVKLEALETRFGLLTKAMELLATPQRKAVTAASQVPFLSKGEDVKDEKNLPKTRDEAIAKLNEKARDPKLSKSDRALITAFSVRKADLSQIEHLLK